MEKRQKTTRRKGAGGGVEIRAAGVGRQRQPGEITGIEEEKGRSQGMRVMETKKEVGTGAGVGRMEVEGEESRMEQKGTKAGAQ